MEDGDNTAVICLSRRRVVLLVDGNKIEASIEYIKKMEEKFLL